jgi:hypothetical protein
VMMQGRERQKGAHKRACEWHQIRLSCWDAQSAHCENTLIQIGSLPFQYLRCREALQTLAAGTQLGWRLI